MRHILLISFLFLINNLFVLAQREILPEIGFSGNGAFFGNYVFKDYNNVSGAMHRKLYYSEHTYFGFNARIGGRIKYQNRSLLFSGTYHRVSSQNKDTGKFIFSSDLLGIDTELRLFEKSKARLFLNLQLMTEVYSKYNYGYLTLEDYKPIVNYFFYPSSSNPTETVRTNIYRGTPFLSNILIGCNLQITKSMSLNVSAGYGLKVLRTQKASLFFDEKISSSEPKSITFENDPYFVAFHMFSVQTGLSYTFKTKK